MAQPGMGGLDTPRTNIGDATYLSRQPDFDMSQELSFQSPSKDANLLHQLRNGGRPTLKTPRGNRAPFTDRRNLPAGLAGAEFTPLLKSATMNSARRGPGGVPGKENGLQTPAFLARIDEDMTPMPAGETSVYGASRNASSYMDNTPLPAVADDSSVASTPLVMRRRGDGADGPLEDGNQLSLREQENVIDRIEKENFGLKLKIHFLEEALRKAGPSFSAAALKENTELKVDKVTMQRELQRYKKHLTSAEKDLETYRQQIIEVQEKAKRKYADEAQRVELERLRQALEEKEQEVEHLQRQAEQTQDEHDKIENLQDEIGDLEADVRRKDQLISEREDELDDLKEKVDEFEGRLKDSQRRVVELEEKARDGDQLQEAKETIEDLKDKLQDAVSEKERAEADLDELQEELADKSMVTKGLSRQVEEKVIRLQADLEKSRQECRSLEEKRVSQEQEIENIKSKLKEARQERDSSERIRHDLETKLEEAQNSQHREINDIKSQLREARRECDSSERIRQSLAAKLEEAQADLNHRSDEKALLQTRHDALTNESISLQREVSSLQKSVAELEKSLDQEREHALEIERDIRDQYTNEISRLNDEISDLQAECREKDNLYDNDGEKWETERRNLVSERDRAEERATGLQRPIDRLRDTEGALSNKELQMKEALQSEMERHKSEESVLCRQIDDLQQNLDSQQSMLEELRKDMSAVRDQLRQSQLDCQTQRQTVEALEDEVEVLQATIDEESDKARIEQERAKQECDSLKAQLASLQVIADSAYSSNSASQESARQTSEGFARLKFQLADSTESLARVTKERHILQERCTAIDGELRAIRTALAETKAERDDLEADIQQLKEQGEDTFRFDQERLDLRTAKTRLDSELRRLKEENKALADQRDEVEKLLEIGTEKATAEEERLNQEIRQLQVKLRQASDSQELSVARRNIRELERRIEDYEFQLAAAQIPAVQGTEGNSELSLLHRGLSAARQKEIDLLKHDSTQKETIKSLKRQIAELERKAHEAALDRLVQSPSSRNGSAQKVEISELRHQLSAALQSTHDLKKALRDAEHKAAATTRELQARIKEIEDQKFGLEQALDDAQVAAEEYAASHEQALKKYKHKLDKYRRERDELATAAHDQQHGQSNHSGISDMTLEERRDLHNMLRESQLAADKLDREVREQRVALEELMAVEMALHKKLDRARSERAAYRASAEKLQRVAKTMQAEKDKAVAEAASAVAAAAAANEERALVQLPRDGTLIKSSLDNRLVDTDAIIRAAEAAERRHEKEIRGMVMQMEWLKACWDREAKLRSDAAFAKRYLQLEVKVRDACNKADLAIINRIRASLNPSSSTVLGQLSSVRSSQQQQQQQQLQSNSGRGDTLRRVLHAVRFVVRMQISARNWAKHDEVRQRLADAVENMEREERIKKMRDQWRAQVGQKTIAPRPSAERRVDAARGPVVVGGRC